MEDLPKGIHLKPKDIATYLGVSKETILSETKLPSLKMNKLLEDCLRDGIIYEPRIGFYKLTREYY